MDLGILEHYGLTRFACQFAAGHDRSCARGAKRVSGTSPVSSAIGRQHVGECGRCPFIVFAEHRNNATRVRWR